jgi:hypothetical protein
MSVGGNKICCKIGLLRADHMTAEAADKNLRAEIVSSQYMVDESFPPAVTARKSMPRTVLLPGKLMA